MSSTPTGPGLPQVTSADLKNANPYNINNVFRLLASQIQSITAGGTGGVSIPRTITAQAVTLGQQNINNLPGDNQAISLALAKQLFSPQALKQSIINNNFLGTTVTSLPGGAGTGLTVVDTHAHRGTGHPAGASPVGTLYYETDRNAWYLDELVSNQQAWVWVFGVDSGTVVSVDQRPTDLGINDNGFQFYATDLRILMTWNGTSSLWVPSPETWPTLQGTRANRVANFPATDYAVGQEFYETDTGLGYIVEKPGAGNIWQYKSGVYYTAQAGIAGFIATLTTNDTNLIVAVTDFYHQLYWGGSALTWNFGDDGSDRFTWGAAPSMAGWVACAGQTVAYLNPDGTTGSRTLPPSASTPHFIQSTAAGSYVPTIQVEVDPVANTTLGMTVDVVPAGSTLVSTPIHTHTGSLPARATLPLYYRI